MWICEVINRVPGSTDHNKWHDPNRNKSESNTRLDTTRQHTWSPVLLGVRQILPEICAELCISGESPTGVDQKGHPMAMGAVPSQSIQRLEGCFVSCANSAVPWPEATIYCGDRCIADCSWGCADARPWWKSETPCVLKKAIEANRTALFSVWTQIGSSGILFSGMATLCGRLSRRSYNHHKSSDVNSPYRAASPSLCTNAMGSVGFVSVHPTNHQIPTG